MPQPPDYYQILGVPRQASDVEIRRAFRMLAKALHPDSNRLENEAGKEYDFRTINEAYETLKDHEKRKAYDEALARARSIVSQGKAERKSSHAFVAGLTIGLAFAFAVIGFIFYSDRLSLKGRVQKAQDSLSRVVVAGVPKGRVATADEPAEVTNPSSNEPAKSSGGLKPAGAEPPASEQKQAPMGLDGGESVAAKSQSRLGSEPPNAEASAEPEQKPASSQSDHTADSRDPSQELQTVAKEDRLQPKELPPGPPAPQPNPASFSETIAGIEANIGTADGKQPDLRLVSLIKSATKLDELSEAALKAKKPETRELINQRIEELRGHQTPAGNGTNPVVANAHLPKSPNQLPSIPPQPAGSPPKQEAFVDVLTGAPDRQALLHLKPGGGVSFSDCQNCPEMVVVPAGQFLMGSKPGEEGYRYDEGPAHRVVFAKAFAVSKYEVSNENWRACIRDGGCRAAQLASFLARPEMPATRLSWYDAKGYVDWLSEKTGKIYRLPSEAEWEYVVRAGAARPATRLFASDRERDRVERVNYDLLPFQSRLRLMKSLSVNAWGLRNLGGRTVEWVEDCWHGTYARAPSDGSAWLSASNGDCSHRTLRGALLSSDFGALRPSARAKEYADMRAPSLGFRVVREISVPAKASARQ